MKSKSNAQIETENEIKFHHYIQGNNDSGIIGHRSDCLDYEDIEEVGKDNIWK